ncbi:hypothetical protein SLA2020_123740 [Shorea laevis]
MAMTKSFIAALTALFFVSSALATADVPFIVVHKKASLNRLKSGSEHVSVSIDVYNQGSSCVFFQIYLLNSNSISFFLLPGLYVFDFESFSLFSPTTRPSAVLFLRQPHHPIKSLLFQNQQLLRSSRELLRAHPLLLILELTAFQLHFLSSLPCFLHHSLILLCNLVPFQFDCFLGLFV